MFTFTAYFSIFLVLFFNALISFVGAIFLNLERKKLLYIVFFASGVLLSASILHLLPEGFEKLGSKMCILLFLGILLFLLLEKYIHMHHCHKGMCKKPIGYLILVGDGVHNFTDGIIIASSFLIDFRLGVITSLSVLLHEIAQELGDFAILINAGFEKKKALLYNFISQLTCFLGAIFVLLLPKWVDVSYFIPFAAASFLYIAMSDLIPELISFPDWKGLLFFLFGVMIIVFL